MEYVNKRSIIHSIHPLVKLIWAVVIMILSLIFNDPIYLGITVLSIIAVAFIGRVSREIMKYLTAMLFLIAFVFVLQVIFRPGGDRLFTVFPASWPVVGGWLPVTSGGVLYGIVMSLRILCLVSVFPVILNTTQPRDIIMTLVDTLHMPYDYAFMFTTALRFMPVFINEVSTISQAQRSRAYAVEGWNPIRKMQAYGPIALPVVFIGIEKADRLGLSMELRGYGNKNRTYLRKWMMGHIDWIATSLLVIVMVGSIIAARLGYGHVDLTN